MGVLNVFNVTILTLVPYSSVEEIIWTGGDYF